MTGTEFQSLIKKFRTNNIVYIDYDYTKVNPYHFVREQDMSVSPTKLLCEVIFAESKQDAFAFLVTQGEYTKEYTTPKSEYNDNYTRKLPYVSETLPLNGKLLSYQNQEDEILNIRLVYKTKDYTHPTDFNLGSEHIKMYHENYVTVTVIKDYYESALKKIADEKEKVKVSALSAQIKDLSPENRKQVVLELLADI